MPGYLIHPIDDEVRFDRDNHSTAASTAKRRLNHSQKRKSPAGFPTGLVLADPKRIFTARRKGLDQAKSVPGRTRRGRSGACPSTGLLVPQLLAGQCLARQIVNDVS